ncbi:MAG: hypothetical protein HYS98_01305 [Deltaproteobacteria bacterium]|nr:hypothetical protein [Deltaproteobacteria bacterium]
MKVVAPGRVCLFGEHQDYFGLSVVAMAIDKKLSIEVTPTSHQSVLVHMPDINKTDQFELKYPLPYNSSRDYVRAGLNVFAKMGFKLEKPFHATIRSLIPIAAGCSSSSALCVGWTKTLSEILNHPQKDDAEWIAQTAFKIEVLEFQEGGGMMDHYASSLGGMLSINFEKDIPTYERLEYPWKGLLLCNSDTQKETVETIKNHKKIVLGALSKMSLQRPLRGLAMIKPKTLASLSIKELKSSKNKLSQEEYDRLLATITNRDLCKKACAVIHNASNMREESTLLGQLFNEQQQTISKLLKLSTPQIDHLLELALKAGALGGKVNGSGGGGTFIVFAPDKYEGVQKVLKENGCKSELIHPSTGVHIEKPA